MNPDKFSWLSIASFILCGIAIFGFYLIARENNGMVDPNAPQAYLWFFILMGGAVGLAIDVFQTDKAREGWGNALGWLIFALAVPGVIVIIRRLFF